MLGSVNLAKKPWLWISQTSRVSLVPLMLLNGHSIKLLSKFISLHSQIDIMGIPHCRRFFVQWMAIYTETGNCPKCREYVSVGCSSVHGVYASLTRPQGPSQKKDKRDCKRQRLERLEQNSIFWAWLDHEPHSNWGALTVDGFEGGRVSFPQECGSW